MKKRKKVRMTVVETEGLQNKDVAPLRARMSGRGQVIKDGNLVEIIGAFVCPESVKSLLGKNFVQKVSHFYALT